MSASAPLGRRYYLLASSPFVALFGLIPATLYAHSGEDWGFPASLLLALAALGLALYGVAALALRLLAAWRPRAAQISSIALFCLGLLALLAHVYAPIQTGALDGSALKSGEPLAYSLIELGLIALLLGVFVLLCRGRGLPVASLFAGLLLLVCAGYLAAVGPLQARGPGIAEVRAADLAEPEGNVYHIVLDMLDTGALLTVLDRLEAPPDLQGFDLFENNISNYINTIPSSASYLSGTFYHEGKLDDWVRAWRERGLFATMRERGYTITMYTPFPQWRDGTIHNFNSLYDVYEQTTGSSNARFYDFLQIWLASLAPNVLTNEALAAAGAFRKAAFTRLTSVEPLSGADGVGQYASVLTLRQLRAKEENRPDRGQYIYAHALLPHGPEVIDAGCRYKGPPRSKRSPADIRADLLEQAECALGLVMAFLERLKELGRYDTATILLHADTGHWTSLHTGDTADLPMTVGRPNVYLASWARASLAIKRPHADHAPRVLDTPTQLVDLFPTLLDVLDIEPPYPMHGRSVYSPQAAEPREARFGFDPTRAYGHDILEFRIDDPTNLATTDLTILGPAIDPGLWREEIRNGAPLP